MSMPEADFLQRQRVASTTALCAECFMEQGFAGAVLGSADGRLAACSLAAGTEEPLLRDVRLHEAGLNGLALRVSSEPQLIKLLVLSAGDDHRVALCRLDLALSPMSCTVAATQRVDCAHTSAVRDVAWAGLWALCPGCSLSQGALRPRHQKPAMLLLHHLVVTWYDLLIKGCSVNPYHKQKVLTSFL